MNSGHESQIRTRRGAAKTQSATTSSATSATAKVEPTACLSKKVVRTLPEPEVDNPFKEEIDYWTWPLKIQMALSFIFILPVRVVMFTCSMFVLWVAGSLITCKATVEDPYLSPWRRFLVWRVLYPTVTQAIRFSMGYQWLHVKGRRVTKEEAPILVIAPHSAITDIIIVGSQVLGSPVAKAETISTPIAGSIVKLTEPILVERSAKDRLQMVVEKVKDRLKVAVSQVLFFPEGTTTAGKSLINFKTGAFQLGLPVQPVLFVPSQPWQTWTFIGKSGLMCLLLTLASPHNRLTVEFLPVYHPNEKEKADPKLYAKNVQQLMAKALGKPCSDHTFEDARLMMKAISLGLPEDTGLLEYSLVRNMTKLEFEDYEGLLVRFSEMDTNKDGYISREEMAQCLHWPVEEDTLNMFSKYDTAKRGKITYREFVLGYYDLCCVLLQDDSFVQRVTNHFGSDLTEKDWKTAFSLTGSSIASLGCLQPLTQDDVDTETCLKDLIRKTPELCYLLQVRFLEEAGTP